MTIETTTPEMTVLLVNETQSLDQALNAAHHLGTLEPFPDYRLRLAGAEVFASADRTVLLVRQYDIRTDTMKWHVRVIVATPAA